MTPRRPQDGPGRAQTFFSAPEGSQERSWKPLGTFLSRSQAPRAVRKLSEAILERKMLFQSPPGPSKIVLPCRRELNYHMFKGFEASLGASGEALGTPREAEK